MQSARFSVGSSGPKSIEGQRAIVFFGSTNDGPIAVRCLKRPLEDGAERYGALRAADAIAADDAAVVVVAVH